LRDVLASAQPGTDGPLELKQLEASWNAQLLLPPGDASSSVNEFLESPPWQALLGRGLALL
jgi:hypothetical protein